MKLQIHASLGVRCIEFLQRKLAGFDTSALDYIRLYDRTGKTASCGTWGRCAFPNRKKRLGYRIRCCVAITARELPYRVKWAIGTKPLGPGRWEWVWREDRFETKEEAFVWIVGNEAFHWLRHSRQTPGQNFETQANRYGFAWLDEWRKLTAEGPKDKERGRSHTQAAGANAATARIFYPGGRVDRFPDQSLAYALWLGLGMGVRVAFRGTGDVRPVYPWDYVDAL
jgi:hypothetical protein